MQLCCFYLVAVGTLLRAYEERLYSGDYDYLGLSAACYSCCAFRRARLLLAELRLSSG